MSRVQARALTAPLSVRARCGPTTANRADRDVIFLARRGGEGGAQVKEATQRAAVGMHASLLRRDGCAWSLQRLRGECGAPAGSRARLHPHCGRDHDRLIGMARRGRGTRDCLYRENTTRRSRLGKVDDLEKPRHWPCRSKCYKGSVGPRCVEPRPHDSAALSALRAGAAAEGNLAGEHGTIQAIKLPQRKEALVILGKASGMGRRG
eukprot:351816-Chlamydomonas_euryale.AAC.5